ncbi:MAG TPA: CPBP family glutamic-type intramembrane protease [Rhodanobacteraceae bacterium]|nr:CPBP family glutamic-type intramembrane protease [Rhodanobacteraceae bacterium]
MRNALPVMPWEAHLGLSHAMIARFLGLATLALLTLLAMVLCRDISWLEFGFRRAKGAWLRFAGGALLLGAVSTLVLKWSGGGGLDAAMAGVSPVELALLLVLATCVEELFVRGWIQGFLAPLRANKIELFGFEASTPVVICALAFGSMHLSLTLAEIDAFTIVCVLSFTTLLGLLAGLARERTGSLMPAIGTHLAGNVGGIVGGIAYAIATGAVRH